MDGARGAMSALFVLLPAGAALATPAGVDLRRYPTASDERHLLSLIRDGRDRAATRWLRGLVLAVAGGAALGALVNAVLAGAFDMLGGEVALATALGFALGAFLGGFTAAMTGTQVARPELRALARRTHPGDVLHQYSSHDRAALQELRRACEARDHACVLVD